MTKRQRTHTAARRNRPPAAGRWPR